VFNYASWLHGSVHSSGVSALSFPIWSLLQVLSGHIITSFRGSSARVNCCAKHNAKKSLPQEIQHRNSLVTPGSQPDTLLYWQRVLNHILALIQLMQLLLNQMISEFPPGQRVFLLHLKGAENLRPVWGLPSSRLECTLHRAAGFFPRDEHLKDENIFPAQLLNPQIWQRSSVAPLGQNFSVSVKSIRDILHPPLSHSPRPQDKQAGEEARPDFSMQVAYGHHGLVSFWWGDARRSTARRSDCKGLNRSLQRWKGPRTGRENPRKIKRSHPRAGNIAISQPNNYQLATEPLVAPQEFSEGLFNPIPTRISFNTSTQCQSNTFSWLSWLRVELCHENTHGP